MFFIPKAFAASVFVGGSLFVASSPAKALLVTTPIQNSPLPVTVTGTPNSSSTTALQFKAFNATNFPAAFAGLLPNQTLQLNNIALAVKGKASGNFTVANYNAGARGTVASPAITFTLLGNNLPTAANSTTNAVPGPNNNNTDQIPRATITSVSLPVASPNPQNPAIYQTCSIDVTDGITNDWLCNTPGFRAFNVNSAGAISNINWTVSPGSGQTYALSNPFWTTGTNINLPTAISFSTLSSALSSGSSIVDYNAAFLIDSPASDTFLTYDYSVFTNTGVPAPLPILGAGIGFGFSRRLRRRIKSASTFAS